MTYDEWCTRWDQQPWAPITTDDLAMFRNHIQHLENTVTELEAELDRRAAIAPIPDPYPEDAA